MTNKEAIRILKDSKVKILPHDLSFHVVEYEKNEALDMAIEALEQKPKMGHWIQTNEFFINQDGQFIYKFICSKCKSLSYFRKSNKKAIGANVCPNCGAKMEVEE